MISYFESKPSVDEILLNLVYVHVDLLTINKVPFDFKSDLFLAVCHQFLA